MSFSITSRTAKLATLTVFAMLLWPSPVLAAPSVEVAKRCVHYAYIVYPWKRPGSGPMSGDRQAYINDCFAKNGNVPEPARPPKQ